MALFKKAPTATLVPLALDAAQQAIEDYKTHDEWQFADREATWRWMFERGQEIGAAQQATLTADNARLIGLLNDVILSSNANNGDALADAINTAYEYLGERVAEGLPNTPMYAIGVAANSQLTSFNMTDGPTPALADMLGCAGAQDAYILQFESEDCAPVPIRCWNEGLGAWEAMLPPPVARSFSPRL